MVHNQLVDAGLCIYTSYTAIYYTKIIIMHNQLYIGTVFIFYCVSFAFNYKITQVPLGKGEVDAL